MDFAKGKLFVLSGPSGVGKGTVAERLKKEDLNIEYSVSVTTRSPRPGEKHGVDYFFIDREKYFRMLKNNELLESARVHNNFYGTPRKNVEEILAKGNNVILEIDIKGARQIRTQFPEAILIFLMPPSMEELEKRLEKRDSESEKEKKLRLENASKEIQERVYYDYEVVNDCLEDTIDQLKKIIKKETAKRE